MRTGVNERTERKTLMKDSKKIRKELKKIKRLIEKELSNSEIEIVSFNLVEGSTSRFNTGALKVVVSTTSKKPIQ